MGKRDAVFYPHTCTITPYTEGAADALGQPTLSAGTAVTAQACQFQDGGTRELAGRYLAHAGEAKLWLPAGATVAQGSKISALADADGNSLTSETFEVAMVRPQKGTGIGDADHIEVELARAG